MDSAGGGSVVVIVVADLSIETQGLARRVIDKLLQVRRGTAARLVPTADGTQAPIGAGVGSPKRRG